MISPKTHPRVKILWSPWRKFRSYHLMQCNLGVLRRCFFFVRLTELSHASFFYSIRRIGPFLSTEYLFDPLSSQDLNLYSVVCRSSSVCHPTLATYPEYSCMACFPASQSLKHHAVDSFLPLASCRFASDLRELHKISSTDACWQSQARASLHVAEAPVKAHPAPCYVSASSTARLDPQGTKKTCIEALLCTGT